MGQSNKSAMKLQTIKCKTCNKVFAACKDEYADDEWEKQCRKYVSEGNSVVETVEPVKGVNVFGDEPLNPCCGKPAEQTSAVLQSRITALEEENARLREALEKIRYMSVCATVEANRKIRFYITESLIPKSESNG